MYFLNLCVSCLICAFHIFNDCWYNIIWSVLYAGPPGKLLPLITFSDYRFGPLQPGIIEFHTCSHFRWLVGFPFLWIVVFHYNCSVYVPYPRLSCTEFNCVHGLWSYNNSLTGLRPTVKCAVIWYLNIGNVNFQGFHCRCTDLPVVPGKHDANGKSQHMFGDIALHKTTK